MKKKLIFMALFACCMNSMNGMVGQETQPTGANTAAAGTLPAPVMISGNQAQTDNPGGNVPYGNDGNAPYGNDGNVPYGNDGNAPYGNDGAAERNEQDQLLAKNGQDQTTVQIQKNGDLNPFFNGLEKQEAQVIAARVALGFVGFAAICLLCVVIIYAVDKGADTDQDKINCFIDFMSKGVLKNVTRATIGNSSLVNFGVPNMHSAYALIPGLSNNQATPHNALSFMKLFSQGSLYSPVGLLDRAAQICNVQIQPSTYAEWMWVMMSQLCTLKPIGTSGTQFSNCALNLGELVNFLITVSSVSVAHTTDYILCLGKAVLCVDITPSTPAPINYYSSSSSYY